MALSRERFSTIAHTGMVYWNPVSPDLIDALVDGLPLDSQSRVLDVGCGRGELLLRIIARHDCRGIGVDSSPMAHAIGQEALARRLPDADCELRCAAFEAADFTPRSFDLFCCVGSTHAIANYGAALEVLQSLVRPGGHILIGEGYWRREPDAGYLDFLQSTRDELGTHQGNVDTAASLGLQLVSACEATPADWGRYEDAYADNIYKHLAANPGDPDATAMRQRIDAWRDAYLRWGRDTLGFGLYLLRTPA